MSENGENGKKKYTAEEIKQILQENMNLKERLAKRSASSGNTWARQKERMATDPEYAARVKEKRSIYAARQREKAKTDPEFKAKQAEKAKERRIKQQQELKELREFKKQQEQSALAGK